MPDSLREEVDYYLEQIALRRKTTRYSATLGGGMQWDSNRNAGPGGDEVLFLDTPFQLVEGKKQSDFSGVMLAGLRAQHDLGYDAGHMLVGGLQVYGTHFVGQSHEAPNRKVALLLNDVDARSGVTSCADEQYQLRSHGALRVCQVRAAGQVDDSALQRLSHGQRHPRTVLYGASACMASRRAVISDPPRGSPKMLSR